MAIVRPYKEHVLTFSVVIHSTDPPPEWGERTLIKLTREIELMYGSMGEVGLESSIEVMVLPETVKQSDNGHTTLEAPTENWPGP